MENKFNAKNIFFVLASTNLGGAEKQAIFLGKELKERFSANVFFVLLGDEKGLGMKYIDQLGIQCFVLKKIQWMNFPRFSRLINLFKLFLFINDKKIDVLLPYTYEANLYAGLICRILRIKVCIWNQRDAGLGIELNFQTRCALKGYDCFIANSRVGCEYLKHNLKIEENLVHLVYNGKLPSKPYYSRDEWRQKMKFEFGDILVVMVSNIQRNKDHSGLIDIWKEIKSDVNIPSNVFLLLAGRIDEGYEFLTTKIAQLGLTDSVRFCGEVEDVSGLYLATDIAMLVSKSEGFPNVVLEAMEASLPVIGSDIPGIKDVVGKEMEKYLFPIGDKNKGADILKQIIIDSDLRREIGTKNNQRVLKHYSIDNLANNTVVVINRYI